MLGGCHTTRNSFLEIEVDTSSRKSFRFLINVSPIKSGIVVLRVVVLEVSVVPFRLQSSQRTKTWICRPFPGPKDLSGNREREKQLNQGTQLMKNEGRKRSDGRLQLNGMEAYS